MFHIDFNSTNFKEKDALKTLLEETVSAWERKYPPAEKFSSIGKRFGEVLRAAHRCTGRRCVVLIDEYDKPLLDVLDTGLRCNVDGNERMLEDWHRDVLKGFYSVFKAADEDLKFVLLTGVTKFSQVSIFSGFNQPNDISMSGQYEALCGITQQELEQYFAEPIADMADAYGTDVDEMLAMLKRQYDGYHFSPSMNDIYNPFSLLNAFFNLRIDDYWFRSGTPEYLMTRTSTSS